MASEDMEKIKNIAIKELLSTRTLTEISTDVTSSHLVLDVQGKILEQIKNNQAVWEKILQEPPTSFRDKALVHIKEQSRADDLAFSFLTDALNTVKEKMAFSSTERDKIFASSN
ncbi:hypothetical protein HanRHA438_Chr14g0642691 [Helianthus annuus]|nr:hypothetical protein HanRHA438_Chr14g0642691 [Helianthus annuus]